MPHFNICTINGTKHTEFLQYRYRRVQNRAATVLNIDGSDHSLESLDLITHLRHIPIDLIHKDFYSDSFDIKCRYGIHSTLKLEKTFGACSKEIRRGQNVALVAVENHIPSLLLRDFKENNAVRQITAIFH